MSNTIWRLIDDIIDILIGRITIHGTTKPRPFDLKKNEKTGKGQTDTIATTFSLDLRRKKRQFKTTTTTTADIEALRRCDITRK